MVDADVAAAATAGNVGEFVGRFAHGYATHVGDRGSQLSGGQKQRVAIARALVRTPALLILDEASSALDSESERQVNDTIKALLASTSHRTTTLIIAHRLATIMAADKIVVLDAGHVVESGTHAELLAIPNGAYRRLALAQDPHLLDGVAPSGHSLPAPGSDGGDATAAGAAAAAH